MTLIASTCFVLAATWHGTPPAAAPEDLRVISLAPSITETIFALGAGDRVVGVSRYCDYPEASQRLPKMGGHVDPSLEAIVGQRPHAVVTVHAARAALPHELLRLGIPTLVLRSDGYDDLLTNITALGTWLGKEAQAHQLVHDLEAEKRALKAEYQRTMPTRTVIVVGRRPLVAAGATSFLSEGVTWLGLRNVVTARQGYVTLGEESLAVLSPNLILDLTLSRDTLHTPGLRTRVVPAQDQALVRLGPRFVHAVRRLGTRLSSP